MPTSKSASAATGGVHAAAAAWEALDANRRPPGSVEVVRAKKLTGRCVYRLLHATEDGDSVIAKRYRAAAHSIERVFYQEVLPHLAVTTPRYYGEMDAGDGYVWIFLEDAGRQRFEPGDPEHRALAARWLATMHVAAAARPFRVQLPDRGLPHYRRHLEAGRRLIVDNLGNPALRAHEVTLLRSIVARSGEVERRWSELEEICATAPSTLVHGDFRPRNLYVRGGPEGQRLLPIDWELAGWAVPAADLAPKRGYPLVDLEVYCRIVRERWSEFDMSLARRLVWAGLVLRQLAAIEWAAMSLVFTQRESLEDPLSRLSIYHEALGRALEDNLSGARG